MDFCYYYDMTNIQTFMTQEFIQKNVLPSNFTYGKAIYERNGIEIIEQRPDFVEAWAGGLDGTVKEGAGGRRRVAFTIQNEMLHWNCTGNPRNHQIFCKHCVAVALFLIAQYS